MIIISNSTPIISLSTIGYISLLKDLFKEIYIPMAVYTEIRSKKSFGYSEIESEFFTKCEVKGKIYLNLLKRDLDDGESEAIL